MIGKARQRCSFSTAGRVCAPGSGRGHVNNYAKQTQFPSGRIHCNHLLPNHLDAHHPQRPRARQSQFSGQTQCRVGFMFAGTLPQRPTPDLVIPTEGRRPQRRNLVPNGYALNRLQVSSSLPVEISPFRCASVEMTGLGAAAKKLAANARWPFRRGSKGGLLDNGRPATENRPVSVANSAETSRKGSNHAETGRF